jgi:hypothetical protein
LAARRRATTAGYASQEAANTRVDIHPPTFGNRKGTSGVHVAIDDFDSAPHMSLELSLDSCLKPRSGRFDVIHDGKITVGRLGAAKRDVLLDFVAKYAPQLIRERSVVLGGFPTGRALTFADIGEIVFNLLHYAEIRDRFRADYKERRGVKQRVAPRAR